MSNYKHLGYTQGRTLVVPGLRLCPPNAGSLGAISGWGTGSHILHLRVCMPWRRPGASKQIDNLKRERERDILSTVLSPLQRVSQCILTSTPRTKCNCHFLFLQVINQKQTTGSVSPPFTHSNSRNPKGPRWAPRPCVHTPGLVLLLIAAVTHPHKLSNFK